MAFKPPDPNVFYPIPQGQLPPGFITPPPGTAVRGIPIVVPHGLEMLISPEGFPVFVPDRAQAAAAAAAASPPPSSPAYVSSPPAASHQSPMPSTPTRHNTAASLHSINQYPTPPTRHSTMPSQHQFPTPPPPVPPLPAPYASGTLPHQMPVPTHPSFASPAHMPLAHAPPSHAPPGYPVQSFAHPSHAPPAHAPPAPAPAATAPAPAAPVGLTFASIVTSFRTSSESVSAWTFYSLGLVHNPGQKEIVITLRQRPGSYTLESVQPTMYHLYHKMNATIQQSGGKPLAAGDVFPCRLDTPDMGPLDVAVLLIHAPPECKGTLENKDVLYGLIATLDEMAVFSKYGAARTLTNMGNDLETWPVPLWSDWSRPTMLHLRDFEGSLTESVMVLSTKNIVATLDTITHRLTLVVSTAALELIQVELTKYPPAQPGSVSDLSRVTFLLDLDAGAQAYLTWKAGQEGPAIFNARPNASSFHGCWLTFVGISPHDEGKVGECILPREDGIEIKMKGATWERLYQALMSRAPAVIPVGEETVQLSYA